LSEGSYRGDFWLIEELIGHPYSFIFFLFGRQLMLMLVRDSMEELSKRGLLAFSLGFRLRNLVASIVRLD
jgi:hypothetical protein